MNALLFFISSIILALIFTGGFQIQHPSFKLDLTQVDTFGGIFLGFLLLHKYFALESFSPVWQKWNSFTTWATQKKTSMRWTFLMCVFFMSLIFIAHLFKNWSFQTAAFDQTSVHQPIFFPWTENLLLKCDICRGPSYLSEHLSFSISYFWNDLHCSSIK